VGLNTRSDARAQAAALARAAYVRAADTDRRRPHTPRPVPIMLGPPALDVSGDPDRLGPIITLTAPRGG
jgi:hypothetical protein